ncbi:MAG TPA: bifunctional hydroxymethylpyrimidine kinase/phosphomethylpyrimidine kinase, partial [Euzebyales bacterium]|nr:bifunctional hydroxymethylpyrimidine kinase/phosphomethylpyrimidine kinase [Euzebyales bacterium]
DLKTFAALGTFGCSVITALTAQNTRAVTAIHEVPPAFVTAQLDAVFDDIEIAAVKIGMLSNSAIIEAVATGLERHAARNVVLDPVMVAKSGDVLLEDDAIAALRDRLLPMATVITPNLPEASVLLDREAIDTVEDMERAAKALAALGPRAVLLKGGHLDDTHSRDVSYDARTDAVRHLDAIRIDTPNTHGTGCTLSSAIAAFLARGAPLELAIDGSKTYITDAIRAGAAMRVGSGHGPVHHFARLWREP